MKNKLRLSTREGERESRLSSTHFLLLCSSDILIKAVILLISIVGNIHHCHNKLFPFTFKNPTCQNQNKINTLRKTLNNELARKVKHAYISHEDSCSSWHLFFPLSFFYYQVQQREHTNKSCNVHRRRFPSSRNHYLHESERYSRSWSWAGSRSNAGEAIADNTVYLSRAFYGNSFRRPSGYND